MKSIASLGFTVCFSFFCVSMPNVASAQNVSVVEKIYNNTNRHFAMWAKDSRNLGVFKDDSTGKKIGDNDWDHVVVIPPNSIVKADFCGIPWYYAGRQHRTIIEISPSVAKRFNSSDLDRFKSHSNWAKAFNNKSYMEKGKHNGLMMWQSAIEDADAIRFSNPGNGKEIGFVSLGKKSKRSFRLIISEAAAKDAKKKVVKDKNGKTAKSVVYELKLENSNSTFQNITKASYRAARKIAKDYYEDSREIRVEGSKILIETVAKAAVGG